MAEATIKNHAAFIWSVADLLRGDYKQSEYGKVILPLTVLRRLDCVLEPTKPAVLERAKALKGQVENVEPVLRARRRASSSTTPRRSTSAASSTTPARSPATCAPTSPASPPGPGRSSRSSTSTSRSPGSTEANLLYLVIGKFAEIDLHPEVVSNIEMGYLYEELIRRFSELSNETAGEHFTPREVIRLMVNLLFAEDDEALTEPGRRAHALRPGLRHRAACCRWPRTTCARSTPTPGSRSSARS